MFEVHVTEDKNTEICQVVIILAKNEQNDDCDKISFLSPKLHVTRRISRELQRLGF